MNASDRDAMLYEAKMMAKKQAHQKRVTYLLSVGTALASIAFALTAFVQSHQRRLEDKVLADREFDAANQELRNKLESLTEMDKVQKGLDQERQELNSLALALKAKQPESAILRSTVARVAAIEASLATVQQENDSLTKLLGDDPLKKMSLVILSRDVAGLKDQDAKDLAALADRYKADIAALRDENKSQFDFIKWAVLFAGASNLLGPLLALVQRGKLGTTTESSSSTGELGE
jgi:hypothetical protein